MALTHVDTQGLPCMVDVTDKQVSVREAVARARVVFPDEVAATLQGNDLRTAKGSIIDTAIIAGTMAAKRTHDLIPFCHPLPVEACRIEAGFESANVIEIRARVRTTHKTGVEMEALTAASVAALTIYDMCKALSHAIRITDIELVSKRGGKSDVGEA